MGEKKMSVGSGFYSNVKCCIMDIYDFVQEVSTPQAKYIVCGGEEENLKEVYEALNKKYKVVYKKLSEEEWEFNFDLT